MRDQSPGVDGARGSEYRARLADATGTDSARGRSLASPTTALAVGVLLVALLAVFVVLSIASDQVSASQLTSPLPLALSFGVVGFVVARRQPRNIGGWILIGTSVLVMLNSDGGLYERLAYHVGRPRLPLAAVGVSPS